jgi:hypothetical protein
MSDVVTAAAAAAADPNRRARFVRRSIFFYDLAFLALLLLAAALYLRGGRVESWVPAQVRGLPAYTAWFGMLGSVAISLKGVYDWEPIEALWSGRWPLWYFGRPFSGLIVGIMTYSIFRAIYPSGTPSVPTFETAAFILGTQEQRFFLFLTEVGKLILNVPDSKKKPKPGDM